MEEAFGGFYCDFFFSQPFSSEILIQLEERIRQIVREKREIRKMEMVPYSASEWLKKSGQKERAAQVLAQEGYVRIDPDRRSLWIGAKVHVVGIRAKRESSDS